MKTTHINDDSLVSSIAQGFLQRLKKMTEQEPLVAGLVEKYLLHQDPLTFEIMLKIYAHYFNELISLDQQKLADIFWQQIAFFGTPIIENDLQNDKNCRVYFLFPKNKLSASEEVSDAKKDLYLQGDFHGYGATDGRQQLRELSNTGVMWRMDSMPRNAIIVYHYIEVEPKFRGISPQPELSPFFEEQGFTFRATNPVDFPTISQSVCSDEYSQHTFPYPGFAMGDRIFRVNAAREQAYIASKPIDWPGLLNTQASKQYQYFSYYGTWYSDKENQLHTCDAPITKEYHNELHFYRPESPYKDFTRDIHFFQPISGHIQDVLVINDGIPYLITGILDYFEKMIDEKKLSAHTAFIFIHPLPGLESTLSPEINDDYNADPSKNLNGMGVRLIDYKHGIDQYIDFLEKLFFQLAEKNIPLPKEAIHRVMIGSSLSGTASLYIGLKRPDLFGGVIAQSPSPDNRKKLSDIAKEMLIESKALMSISCGQFEHPLYAAANDNIGFAQELSHKLGVTLNKAEYGHQFIPWNESLQQSLPNLLNAMHQQKPEQETLLTSQSMFSHSPSTEARDHETDRQLVKRLKGA